MNNHKYICQHEDLDLLLPEDVAGEFREVFTGGHAWRMSFDGRTPQEFWQRFGVSFDHPTVRAAVAIDLIKLEDDSVSNDSTYHLDEHLSWSTAEHERWILNRNFRVNLANLAPGYSEIHYLNGTSETRRTVDREYQGPRLSKSILSYFDAVFRAAFDGDGREIDGFDLDSAYVPFTNANDFTNEIALVPNTHSYFRASTSRSYYDAKYAEYKQLLQRHGILAISTFALVDSDKDKTHAGKWLVKAARKYASGRYAYIVATIDKDGKIEGDATRWFGSERNEILCVCEKDYEPWDSEQSGEWSKVEGDVSMVHSTTSSHYSVFRQRIPDYELKQVRHYIQFRTRLEGMELMLENLKRNVHLKEVQASDCFNRETMSLYRLFKQFGDNEALLSLVMQYYDLVAEYDELYMRLVQLRSLRDEKVGLLNRLIQEYNDLSNPELDGELTLRPDKNLDRKIELGQKIRTLRLEIDKSLMGEINTIRKRLLEIIERVKEINHEIDIIQQTNGVDFSSDEVKDILQQFRLIFSKSEDSEYSKAQRELKRKCDEILDEDAEETDLDSERYADDTADVILDIIAQHIRGWKLGVGEDSIQVKSIVRCKCDADGHPEEKGYDPLQELDTTSLHHLIIATERWRNYMQNMGYELMQMRQMLTMCEDATIKVRRLVHNFKERMERAEEDVWDENHQLKEDFDFKSISSAGIRDIILLHDWYACNAPGKTPEEMGMSDEEFKAFRQRCNTISYNLRKNQYAQSLAMKSHRLQSRIQELEDRLKDIDSLHWKDKYGWEAKKEQEESESRKEWSLDDVDAEKKARVAKIAAAEKGIVLPTTTSIPQQRRNATISLFAKAERAIKEKAASEAQYRRDASRMRDRTLGYLKDIGLIEAESDLESLATRNRAAQFKGDVNAELKKVEAAKGNLDKCVGLMNRERNALKSIIDGVANIETRIRELEETNGRIFSACITERNRQTRNRLLLTKLENETMIADLKQEAKQAKDRHLREFKGLERMRRDVDRAQAEYDKSVKEFKETVGSDSEAVENLMVGIYNRFQDEILKEGR